jgi:phosphoribosylglycinamide formyltransferase-1
VSELLNLIVDLEARSFDADAVLGRLERAGFDVIVGYGAPDRVLAWIDDVFGGSWSSEAAVSTCVVATRAGVPAGCAAVDGRVLRFPWLNGIARESDVGIFGPFGIAPEERGGILGPALLEIAMNKLALRGYARGLIAATNQKLAGYYGKHTGSQVVERFDTNSLISGRARTVVLASGSGTNVQAVIDAVSAGLPLELTALIGNRANAYALERARRAGIEAVPVLWDRALSSRDAYDRALLETVRERDPELVLLLGWMHLLSPQFVDTFPGLLNVHPAFLPLDPMRDDVVFPDGTSTPAFRGAKAVADALTAGAAWVGASVHGVTAQADRGRIYVRKPLRVGAGEDADALLERLHPIEHDLVPIAIRHWLYERT